MKKSLPMITAAAIAMSAWVTGYGNQAVSEVFAAENLFDNAADLTKAYFEQQHDNYRAAYESHLEVGASIAGQTLKMTAQLNSNLDNAGDHMHGTVFLDSESMGKVQKRDIEIYSVKDEAGATVYEFWNDAWIKTVNDIASVAVLGGTQENLVTENKLKDAEFSYDAETEQYELTAASVEAVNYGLIGDFLSEDMNFEGDITMGGMSGTLSLSLHRC